MTGCLSKFWRALGGMTPAMLAGGFGTLAIRIAEPEASRIGLLLVGLAYGAAVLGLIRLFRVAPWAYFLAGIVCGPAPLALLMTQCADASAEDRQGFWFLTMLLGVVIGLLETARVHRVRKSDAKS